MPQRTLWPTGGTWICLFPFLCAFFRAAGALRETRAVAARAGGYLRPPTLSAEADALDDGLMGQLFEQRVWSRVGGSPLIVCDLCKSPGLEIFHCLWSDKAGIYVLQVLEDGLFIVGDPAVAEERETITAELIAVKSRRDLASLEHLKRRPTEVAIGIAGSAWSGMIIRTQGTALTGLPCEAFASFASCFGFHAITHFAYSVHSGISTVLCTVPE